MRIILDLEGHVLSQVLGKPRSSVKNELSGKLEVEGAYGGRADISQRQRKWQQEWKGRGDKKNIEKEDKATLGELHWKSRGFGINQNLMWHFLVL